MTNQILIKRSNVAGRVPTTSNVSAGEFAVNTADGRLFFGIGTRVVEVITDHGIVPGYIDVLEAPVINTTTINYSNGVSATDGTLVMSDTSVHTLESFDITLVRSVEYLIQASSSEGFQLIKTLVIHDGTTPSILTYSNVATNTDLIAIDVSITLNIMSIEIAPNYSDVTIKFVRTQISI